MTITVSDLGHGRLPTAGTNIATSATSRTTRITHCVFYNTHSSSVTVTLYYLRSGESVSSDGAVLVAKTIPPGKSWIAIEAIGINIAQLGALHAVPSVTNVIDYNVAGDIIL